MEEILWKFSRQNRDLRDLRKDIQRVWDDDAARDINRRYLDPHDADAQEMEASLRKQFIAISEAAALRRRAEEEARRATQFAENMVQSLRAVERELPLLFSSFEEATRLHGKGQDLIPIIDQLIQSANTPCEGVLTRDEYHHTYS